MARTSGAAAAGPQLAAEVLGHLEMVLETLQGARGEALEAGGSGLALGLLLEDRKVLLVFLDHQAEELAVEVGAGKLLEPGLLGLGVRRRPARRLVLERGTDLLQRVAGLLVVVGHLLPERLDVRAGGLLGGKPAELLRLEAAESRVVDEGLVRGRQRGAGGGAARAAGGRLRAPGGRRGGGPLAALGARALLRAAGRGRGRLARRSALGGGGLLRAGGAGLGVGRLRRGGRSGLVLIRLGTLGSLGCLRAARLAALGERGRGKQQGQHRPCEKDSLSHGVTLPLPGWVNRLKARKDRRHAIDARRVEGRSFRLPC